MRALLKVSTGFDRAGAELLASTFGGFVGRDAYGPSRELSDWSALLPIHADGSGATLADARELVPGARLGSGRVIYLSHELPAHYRLEANR